LAVTLSSNDKSIFIKEPGIFITEAPKILPACYPKLPFFL
jgi:hypothetical protein